MPTSTTDPTSTVASLSARTRPGDALPATLDEALGRVAARIALLPTTEPLRPAPALDAPAAPVIALDPVVAQAGSWVPRLALLGVVVVGSWAAVITTGAAIWSVVG